MLKCYEIYESFTLRFEDKTVSAFSGEPLKHKPHSNKLLISL